MIFTKPARLNHGDRVAVISPSWGGPSVFPHIYQQGIHVLEQDLGLRVKAYPTAMAAADFLYRHPKARAEDVNNAFADPEVKAIVATIGGDDSVRILPYLDDEVIKQNPKILMGYSDTTTLLTYCNQLGLVTFNGPAIMAGFSQLRAWPQAFAEHIRTMLFAGPVTYTYQPYEIWSEGYPDWAEPENTGETCPQVPNTEGWHWLQGDSVVQGRLFGGGIEVLEFLKGTSFWPKPDFWAGKILFFETSEDVPTPGQVMDMLRNYGMQGIYDQVKGILFGRAKGYSADQKLALEEKLVSVVTTEFGRPDLPIIANMDFGHTDPQFIMPLGVKAEIDCQRKTFKLLEPAVR